MRKHDQKCEQNDPEHQRPSGKKLLLCSDTGGDGAIRCMPAEPQMKVICTETARLCGKNTAAVWRALSRAIDDIWQYGDREALARSLGYLPREKPSPRDLVLSLACQLWCNSDG